MFKLLFFLSIISLILLSAKSIEREIGINIGLDSTKNEDGFKFKNPTLGVTYQNNKYVVIPRVDLEYTKVKNDYASSLLKGSINGLYEYVNRTYTTPYVLAGVGYEYVGGATEDVFESHPFVQGGLGVRVDLQEGIRGRVEGKVLKVLGGNNEGSEAIITAGVSFPLSYRKRTRVARPKVIIKRVFVPQPPKVIVQRVMVPQPPKVIVRRVMVPQPRVVAPPVRPKVLYVNNNECAIKIDAPDLDRDGVEDRFDQCPATPCNFTVDRYGCPIKTTLRVNFATNSSYLDGGSLQKVQNFANFLLNNRGSVVTIVGHTDNVGDASKNMSLSFARANSVVAELIKRGVSPSRLHAEGKGETMPIASNETGFGRAKNRRIEAELSYPKGRE